MILAASRIKDARERKVIARKLVVLSFFLFGIYGERNKLPTCAYNRQMTSSFSESNISYLKAMRLEFSEFT